MKVIPYGRQNITQIDIDAVVETLSADFLTQGPKIKEFESEFADYVGAKYAVAVSNATAGLHIAVNALSQKKHQRVITTPITFAASANCVKYNDGEVWFADIDPDTYVLSVDKVRELIESKPKGFFTGIIPVAFGGLPVDLEKFDAIAKKHNLWIVEDACHAPGAYFVDSKDERINCGSSVYSDCSIFSFHPVKHIACGEGGMITTNSKELYDQCNLLRSHGITKNNMATNEGGWYYEMQALGFNYRLTDIQAALGISQLTKNIEGVRLRNKIAEKYKEKFSGKVKFQDLPEGHYNAHHLFVVEVDDRKGLYEFLRKKSILAQIHYIPVHKLPYYAEIGYDGASLDNAEQFYERCISLPMFPTLTNEEQDFVIENVLCFVYE